MRWCKGSFYFYLQHPSRHIRHCAGPYQTLVSSHMQQPAILDTEHSKGNKRVSQMLYFPLLIEMNNLFNITY